MNKINDFKKDLAVLLEKYNAYIVFDFNGYFYDIENERLEVVFRPDKKQKYGTKNQRYILSESFEVTPKDLKE